MAFRRQGLLVILAVTAVSLAACGSGGGTTGNTSGSPVTGGTLKLLGSSGPGRGTLGVSAATRHS